MSRDPDTPEPVNGEPSARLDIFARLDAVEKSLVEHRVRLSNGTHVLEEMKADILGLKTSITPKPIDWWKVVGSTFAILVTILGAWWALSEKLSDRPTTEQVREAIRLNTTEIGVKLDQTQRDVKDIKDDLRALRSVKVSQ